MEFDPRILFISGLLIALSGVINADNPCAARAVKGRSNLCVCNDTYCDVFIRVIPDTDGFMSYMSSDGGLRFEKTSGKLKQIKDNKCCNTNYVVDPATKYQTIEGFGGAVTDAAGINWKSLSPALQKHLIDSYFGDNGLQYGLLRVPIGGSDFSTRAYMYNELPENDAQLSNYTLVPEDFEYKLPMIKSIQQTSSTPVKLIVTTWSPPLWMKTSNKTSGFSRLKEEFYQTYADYHLKFLQEYAARGVSVWAMTTTNEPINGVIPLVRFNSLGWTADEMGKWIVENLGPTIRNSSFKDIKILANDDQRYSIPILFENMVKEHPQALDYVDGVAVHWYGNFITPSYILSDVPKKYPGKFVLATEASEGGFPWQLEKVKLGAWDRAQDYISDIINDMNHDVVGWIDWNLCLDKQGGPNWSKNYVDAPIIVYPEDGEFVKQPMFYAMGHFSKFIPPGSVRIKITENKPFLNFSVENTAFLTPRNTVVVVLHNKHSARDVAVRIGDKQAELKLEKDSIATVEFPYTA